MKCIDRHCKANNPDNKAICNNCLTRIIKGMDTPDLMDLYFSINNLLHTTNKERELMVKAFGPVPGIILASVEEQWFQFINDLLLDHDH